MQALTCSPTKYITSNNDAVMHTYQGIKEISSLVVSMTKLVVLKLDGDLQMGVRVSLSMKNEGFSPYKEVTGHLPAVPELETTIDQWRSNYRILGNFTRILKAKKVTYEGSISQKHNNCKNSATELQKRLNDWLRSESFRPIRETWLKELKESDLVRVLICTSSHQLRQIPWHLWDLVEAYPYAELALSAPDYQQLTTAITPTKRDKVKILAILGNSTGIDVETDRRLLNSLPDADVTFLVQPQRYEINDSLWEKPWDVLFFAGHSQTVGDSGRIYINENLESLSTDDLKYALKKATSNGLALAIFNSCDGLGLAYELEALHIPQIIVMREPVPDEVAQIFLKHFLVAYATSGKSLYLAVKEARLKLHGLENKYPCASLLPVICQNGGAVPPTWLDLGRRPTKICPYRGLFAFTQEDAQFFFGRESFTNMLVEAVQSQPLVAIIGPSGSGKSSVVFAGLLKRLQDAGNWQIIDFRPGSRPLFTLATALVSQKEAHLSRTERLRDIRNLATDLGQCENGLRDVVDDIVFEDPTKRLLLVADQFEELYTLCRDALERKAFLDRLLEAINHCRNFTFVITLRADFLAQALSYRPFADALQYADLKLGPMTDSELLAAVEKPAALLGVTIEEGLTERILSAVGAEPGDLPLLEFALTQLWAKQLDAQLTHAAAFAIISTLIPMSVRAIAAFAISLSSDAAGNCISSFHFHLNVFIGNALNNRKSEMEEFQIGKDKMNTPILTYDALNKSHTISGFGGQIWMDDSNAVRIARDQGWSMVRMPIEDKKPDGNKVKLSKPNNSCAEYDAYWNQLNTQTMKNLHIPWLLWGLPPLTSSLV